MSDQNEYERSAEAGAADAPDASTAARSTPARTSTAASRAMPLLDLVTAQSMDEDYSIVAERRRQRENLRDGVPAPERRWGTVATVAVVAASALLATVAAVQTSRSADVTALGREALVERIQLAKENVRELQTRSGELVGENAVLEENVRGLREDEEQVTSRVRRLGARTGYLAVRGPGIRVVVDDAPGAESGQRVRDSDLLLLVDGLWAAGAEAVAINGQRLTNLTPLQNSGQAIHVNVRPLSPPYRVEAIGDPDALEGRLLASTGGATFRGVADALGFVTKVEDVEELELPATRVRQLRHAKKLDTDTRARQEDDE